MSYRRRLVIVAVLAVFSSVTTPAQAEEQIVYRTIVQVGDPTFDDPSATFSSLSIPRLNNNGLLAFRARTQGPGGILEGVFGWQAGTGQMVALEGPLVAKLDSDQSLLLKLRPDGEFAGVDEREHRFQWRYPHTRLQQNTRHHSACGRTHHRIVQIEARTY